MASSSVSSFSWSCKPAFKMGFEEAWSSHLVCRIDGMDLPVLGRSALIRNKRAAGRPKDLADLAWLEKSEG